MVSRLDAGDLRGSPREPGRCLCLCPGQRLKGENPGADGPPAPSLPGLWLRPPRSGRHRALSFVSPWETPWGPRPLTLRPPPLAHPAAALPPASQPLGRCGISHPGLSMSSLSTRICSVPSWLRGGLGVRHTRNLQVHPLGPHASWNLGLPIREMSILAGPAAGGRANGGPGWAPSGGARRGQTLAAEVEGPGRRGEAAPGTVFTPFCFSVASAFAKMGLLTFGGSSGCVWPGARRAKLALGKLQGQAGGPTWEAAGRGSEHRACLWVVCVPAPGLAGRHPPATDSGAAGATHH